jgi:hypothetical protein
MFKDTILLTIRGISEAFGISAGYNPTDKSIIFTDSLTTLVLYLDSGKYKLNDQEGTLEVGAMVINGRIFAPLQFIADTFGRTVIIDHESQRIDINK